MNNELNIMINPATVSLNDFKSLFLLAGFRPEFPHSVKSGIILNNHIEKENGEILFYAGSHLAYKELKELFQFAKSNKNYNKDIFITKNNALLQSLKETIVRDIIHIIDTKKAKDECRAMFKSVEKSFVFYLDDFFQSSELIYQLTRMRLLNQGASPEYRPMVYFHTLSVFLYSLGIVKYSYRYSKLGGEDYAKLAQAAFLHNIAVFDRLDSLLKEAGNTILEKYYEINTRSHTIARRITGDSDVANTIKYVNYYHMNEKEFIKRDELLPQFANIILAAQLFNMREMGLFVKKYPIVHIIDELYSLVMVNELNKNSVDALAKGLRQKKLFDFYGGLDDIKKRCLLKQPDKFPIPYPMIGFKSPIVILCKGQVKRCPAFNPSQSVTIFKTRGGLKEGSYNVCNELNKALKELYKQHYSDIKELTVLKTIDESEHISGEL